MSWDDYCNAQALERGKSKIPELTYETLLEAQKSLDQPARPIMYVLPKWLHKLTYLSKARTIQHRITNSKIIPNRFKHGIVTYIVAEELYCEETVQPFKDA